MVSNRVGVGVGAGGVGGEGWGESRWQWRLTFERQVNSVECRCREMHTFIGACTECGNERVGCDVARVSGAENTYLSKFVLYLAKAAAAIRNVGEEVDDEVAHADARIEMKQAKTNKRMSELMRQYVSVVADGVSWQSRFLAVAAGNARSQY